MPDVALPVPTAVGPGRRRVKSASTSVLKLLRSHPATADMTETLESSELPDPAWSSSAADPNLGLLTTPVGALLRREAVTLPPTATIREAAQRMQVERVSSILIIEQDHLFGLVTDRDLRNRVIAAGLPADRPILEIATLAPLHIARTSPAFEALLLMARHNIHHLPVLDGSRVAGMLTVTDLLQQQGTSPVFLAGEIFKQSDHDGLVRVAAGIRPMQRSLANAHASAYSTGHIVTAVTDALTTRLLQLAEARLGPPPVDYAWICAGSQARSEQTARSDQDNGLIVDDACDEARHGAYFRELAQAVNDGLNDCGYVYCPGEMMARTTEWRQPRSRWTSYFRQWIHEPDPTALMLTGVFFDLRLVHGAAELVDELRREVLALTRGNTLFLAHMVSNALSRQPPLNLFGKIAPARNGEHRGTVDLKMNGIVPIVDMARVVALAAGDAAVNTHDRLLHAAASGEMSERNAHDLRDALEFLSTLRIQHQARQMEQGAEPDNHLVVDALSNFERSQLRDAYAVVQALQTLMGQRYQAGRF